MNINPSEKFILDALDWTYEKAINGVAGLGSAKELAENYMKSNHTRIEQVNNLIRWQKTKAATSGFITGFGGLIALPITFSMNVTTVTYVQIRMIAAIAYMGGHDIKDDRIKTLVYICLTGNKAKEIFTDIGINTSKSLVINAAKNIDECTIAIINKKVGISILTKCSKKGMVNLTKMFPLICGFMGATFDSLSTHAIGSIARDTFLEKNSSFKTIFNSPLFPQ